MVTTMANDRLGFAISRLDGAIARIEKHLNARTPSNDREIEMVLDRHSRLRDQVQSAIGRIDRLIQSAEG